MSKKENKQPTKTGDIMFTVKFEDGSTVKLTAAQVSELKDKRRWDVLDSKNVVIMRKVYRGI